MKAGFIDFAITKRVDIYSGAPQEGSAINYGTLGITFRARKPESTKAWHDEMDSLGIELPQD